MERKTDPTQRIKQRTALFAQGSLILSETVKAVQVCVQQGSADVFGSNNVCDEPADKIQMEG